MKLTNVFPEIDKNPDQMLDNINSLQITSKEIVKITNEKVEELLKLKLKFLFQSCDDLEWFRWRQYRNYWNDGSACHFGIRKITFRLKNQEQLFLNHKFEDHGYKNSYFDFDECDYPEGFKKDEKYANFLMLYDNLESFMHKYDDYLENIYGDNVEIKVYHDGIMQIEDYGDHS